LSRRRIGRTCRWRYGCWLQSRCRRRSRSSGHRYTCTSVVTGACLVSCIRCTLYRCRVTDLFYQFVETQCLVSCNACVITGPDTFIDGTLSLYEYILACMSSTSRCNVVPCTTCTFLQCACLQCSTCITLSTFYPAHNTHVY
jgi:hypothetical protein